jgi:hypothetical protein
VGRRQVTRPPHVRLGHVAPNGIAPSVLALVERGAHRRPAQAREMRGKVEIRFEEDYAPVRLSFGSREILVEDASADGGFAPDLVVRGSLPEVVQLAAAPQLGGLPKLTDRRGRRAIVGVARGRVKFEGSQRLGRRLLRLLQI